MEAEHHERDRGRGRGEGRTPYAAVWMSSLGGCGRGWRLPSVPWVAGEVGALQAEGMHVTLARRPRRGGCVPAWTFFAIARPPPSPSLLSPSSPSLQSPRGPRGAHLVIPLALDPVIQNTTPRRLLLPSRFSPLPLPPHALPHPSRPVASPLPPPSRNPFPSSPTPL